LLNLFPFIILTSDLSILFLIFLSAAFACIDSREGAKAANVSAFSYNRFCMIARLKGTVIEKSTQRLLLDVGGVGYEVMIPLSTFYELPEPGKPVSLRIYTHVREDTLALFGFLTGKEKTVFTHLIQISGIGPKLANTILSGLPVDDLVQAVATADIARISSVPGVGKKTAQRMVVELKDKMKTLFLGQAAGATDSVLSESITQDLVSALVNLGYPRNLTETVVSRVVRENQGSFEELLKTALRRFAG